MVAAAVIKAAGGENEIPMVSEQREAFIAALNAEEKKVSPEERDLMEALGVSRGNSG